MTARRAASRPWLAVFAWPIALSLLTIGGLVIGLTGDGWRDAVAALCVGSVPLAIAIGFARRDRPRS